MENTNLLKILSYIDPADCDYQEWVNVGMALKHEGYSVSDWDNWSRRDVKRYHSGDCEKKWQSFNGNTSPVTAGTIVQMAKDRGYTPKEFKTFDWDSEISFEEGSFVSSSNEGIPFHEPAIWNPVSEITRFLELLFDSTENVGYVTSTYEKTEDDGSVKFLPTKGNWDRTAGELIESLNRCNGDIGAVLGDYNEKAGAWVRINPLDGHGVADANVTDYRYVLVESDSLPLERQNALIRELELPVVTLTYTGGKSLHAIVRVDAGNREEYRKRVTYLFDICKKNGLDIDKSCKNPSRLSRLPGILRNGKKQFLIDTNIGKSNWAEWYDFVEGLNDDLPDPESMSDIWDNLPELSPPLIDGVLRQGHKMLIAGPSKAGKSYALIELCCALAEGKKWLGFNCTQGKVMYVNLELDDASCKHRFKDVYNALGWKPEHLDMIDIWNLRGRSVPMDKLAPKLIRRASKKNYIAIIIDPIYKVITGDENSADQMAHFCNQFDKVCTELGCAVIYCHHHSKGNQGGKRSMDRVSGSGVFARDPDALIDLSELELTEGLIKSEEGKVVCKVCAEWLSRFHNDIDELCSQDDLVTPKAMLSIAQTHLQPKSYQLMHDDIKKRKKALYSRTAWRIEGTLREFPKFEPINLWFDYPIHREDTVGVLKDLAYEGDSSGNWQKNFGKKKSNKERQSERNDGIEAVFNACNLDGKVTIQDLAEYSGKSEKTIRRHLKEHGGFWVDGSEVGLKDRDKVE
ncbi:MAG: AAA family ATPase [Oscillospiraceae bacterium]|nr:AAA family ATPase [Oscillospiraceae bacterium]